jgi:hypothetical protein
LISHTIIVLERDSAVGTATARLIVVPRRQAVSVTHYLIEREVLLEGAEHRIRGKMRGNTALLCGVVYYFLQRTRFATASEFDSGSFSALSLERVSFVV